MYKPGKLKARAKGKPCKTTQLRNPDTGNCKECMGFKVPELEGYARKIDVPIERGDTKQDLCNKIFNKVGLRGQNEFDKIISGMIGIPPAEEIILGPVRPILRTKTMFVPYLNIDDRRVDVSALKDSLLVDPVPVNTLDEAIGVLKGKLEQLLQKFKTYPITLLLEKRPEFKYEYDLVLATAEPAAKAGKRQSFLVLSPKNQYLGKLQFEVRQQEVQEEAKAVPVEELTRELALAMALGEAVEKSTKRRGIE